VNQNNLTIKANNVSLSPTVDGQSNVQSALQSVNSNLAPIQNLTGTGYVVQTAQGPPGTFVTRELLSANGNFLINNPFGVAGNTLFTFYPSGMNANVNFTNYVRSYATSNDLFLWRPSASIWDNSSNAFPGTVSHVNDLYVSGSTFLCNNTTTWDTSGNLLQIQTAGWGSTQIPPSAKGLIRWELDETNTNRSYQKKLFFECIRFFFGFSYNLVYM
jgi:hypothetical protein